MTVRDYIRVVRERLLVVVITVVLSTTGALLFSLRQQSEYTATARLLVEQVAPGTEVGELLKTVLKFQNDVATEGELMRSTPVAEAVANRLGLKDSPEKLLEKITVLPYGITAVLNVSAKERTPTLARDIANAFLDEYIAMRRQQALSEAEHAAEQLSQRIAATREDLDKIDQQLRTLRTDSAQYEYTKERRSQLVGLLTVYQAQSQTLLDRSAIEGRGVGRVIQYATAPTAQSGPNHLRNTVLGLIVGIPLALGLTLMMDSMTDTIKTKEEAERLVGAHTLALIPDDVMWRDPTEEFLSTREAPHSPVAEAYRSLRVNLEMANGGGIKEFLLVSPGPEEGKSTTAANLGFAFAEAGRTVALISADLRSPRLHRFFDMDPAPGLSDFARGDVSAMALLREVTPNLWVVPSGSFAERPDQLLASFNFRALITEVTRLASRSSSSHQVGTKVRNGHGKNNGATRNGGRKPPAVVLIDAPGILGAAESSALAPTVSGIVLVLRAGVTRRLAASRAAEQIRKVGGKIVGCVLVGVSHDPAYPHYHSGHSEARRLHAALTKVRANVSQ